MKKIKRNELVPILIDRMLVGKLENVSNRYEYVLLNQNDKDGTPWYEQFTWTDEEEKEYKEYFIDLLVNNTIPAYTLKQANIEYGMFIMNWGLKKERYEEE